MKKSTNLNNTVLIAIVISIIAGGITAYAVVNYELSQPKTQDELIKEFYAVETAAHVSPHGIRKHIMKGETDDFILIDLRSPIEYEEEHIVGAVNVPAYKDPDHSDYGAVERIRKEAAAIQAANPGKDLIVYCYSSPCMTGRKVGQILAEDGIYVKHLGVGWNEWKYFWTLWNHPHETSDLVDPADYVSSGPEPGVFTGRNYLAEGLEGSGCDLAGELGC
ncbi:MAG: hypothetical protein GOV15_02115 [Candidatus Diapherotrites archaeon]|nr:hypothetical protein [Candidatus Diapherotrites archaeon]